MYSEKRATEGKGESVVEVNVYGDRATKVC